jgi:hypothetical protein
MIVNEKMQQPPSASAPIELSADKPEARWVEPRVLVDVE